jgi:regulator of sigma E protease
MILLRSITFLAQNFLLLLIGLIGINFLVGFHELGHFLFAKLFNIRTPTFSIGFGPFVASKKIGDTTFALSSIPLGGYVEIAGAAEIGQGEQKDAHARDAGSFAVKPYWQKMLVMFGGILFNLIFAYAALIFLFMVGLPKTEFLYPRNAKPIIKEIKEESAAQKAGFAVGDRIISINGENINDNGLKAYTLMSELPGAETSFLVEREGQEKEINATLDSKEVADKKIGSLGVLFEISGTSSLPFISAVKEGIALTNAYIKATVMGFKNIFVKRDLSKMGGPIKIISETIKAAGHSFGVFIFFLAIISINLAIMQCIPLPILDGGQILFYTIEALIRRPLSVKIREYIHIASWLLILALVLYLSAQDIYQLVKPYLGKF